MASAMYDGVYCTTARSTAATSVTSVTRGMICRLLFRGASGSEDASESEESTSEGERRRLRERRPRRPRVRMGLVASTSSGGSYGADDCMRERSICEKSSEMLAVVVAGPVRKVGFANEFIIKKQNKNLSTR